MKFLERDGAMVSRSAEAQPEGRRLWTEQYKGGQSEYNRSYTTSVSEDLPAHRRNGISHITVVCYDQAILVEHIEAANGSKCTFHMFSSKSKCPNNKNMLSMSEK